MKGGEAACRQSQQFCDAILKAIDGRILTTALLIADFRIGDGHPHGRRGLGFRIA